MSEVKRKCTNNEVFLFANFIAEKEASGLSKKSIKNYQEVFARFAHQTGQKLSKKAIGDWVHMMFINKMNPISINYYLNQIRVYAYWLMKNGYLERFEIKKIKTQEPQIKTVPEEDIIKLLERPAVNAAFVKFRCWAIVNFILGTGARVSTIINLKVEDIDFASKEIRFTHLKNKTTAIVPLSASLEKVIRVYLNTWEIGSNYLFTDRFGGQLTANALEQSLRNYYKDKGIKPRGAHSLRHTFAKRYITNGGNAFFLQRILTHTDLAMTRKYIRLFSTDLKKDYEKICPLDSYQKQPGITRRKQN